MAVDHLYIDLLAFAARTKPGDRLESRMTAFLESERSTEPLDGAAFARINGSQTKADYLLGARGMVAELKTINGDPHDRMEQRLKARFSQPGAPIVFGTFGISKVIESMPDRDSINKMLVDVAGRAVRRHLQKANEQIAAIKARLGLPSAGGLVILMNDAESMIDAGAIGYAIKSAFQTVEGGYPHITNVWASIESHRIRMADERTGYPQLHIFKSLERQAELDFMARMLGAWGPANGSRLERIEHRGDWDVMRPIYDGPTPTMAPFTP